MVLGVGGLPEQEVRHPQLAAGADDEVGVGHQRSVQTGSERGLVDRVGLDAVGHELADGSQDLVPPAVVEGHPQRQAGVVPRLFLHGRHQRKQVGRTAVTPADELDAHALTVQVGELLADGVGEERHQVGHLVVGPAPVLGREGEDGQALHAQPRRRLDRTPQRSCPRPVARQERQASAACPTGVTVHDDGHRPGRLRELTARLGAAAPAQTPQPSETLQALKAQGRQGLTPP